MDKDTALDLALEALEVAVGDGAHDYQKYLDAITAIKQARSAPVQEHQINQLEKFKNHVLANADALGVVLDAPAAPVQEPDHGDELTIAYMSGVHRGKELAAQRQWVGLTDEEKQEWVEAMPDEPKPRHIMNLINVIEVELKGRNT